MLIDVLLETMGRTPREGYDRGALRALGRARRTAKRFVFDPEATTTCLGWMEDAPHVVTSQLEFAVPPHPDTYVEMHLDDGGDPARAGWTFTREGHLLFTARIDEGVGILPVGLVLRGSEADASTRTMSDDGADDTRRYLAPAVHPVAERWRAFPVHGIAPSTAAEAPLEAGSFASLAGLLLIHRRRGTVVTDVPASRRMVGHRFRAYAAHSVVGIDLSAGPVSVARTPEGGDRASPRRHGVRGHFVHRGVADGCPHDWRRLEGDARRFREDGSEIATWFCGSCDGRRTFKEAHERGDGGVGYVTKTYEVTDAVR